MPLQISLPDNYGLWLRKERSLKDASSWPPLNELMVRESGPNKNTAAICIVDNRKSKIQADEMHPTLAADSGFFHLEARIHRAFQNFKIYVGVATTFVSGKCSFLLKADGLSTRLRTSKLNSADIRSNKPTS